MTYVVFAGIALCIATALLFLQYRRAQGTPEHAKRGWTIFVYAVLALGAIEYALISAAIHLERNWFLLILHLFFALPMLAVLCVTVASGVRAYRRRCICPTGCDCQAPEPKQGAALISNHCPAHNDQPDPYPECPANEHRRMPAGLPTHRMLVRHFPWLWAATITTGILFFFTSLTR